MKKLIRITTVPISLKILLKGQLSFMSLYFEVIGVTSLGKEINEVREDEQIRVIPLSMSRKITPLQDLNSLWQMYWLFKKEKPAIVHTHTPKAGIIGMVAAKLAKVPIRLHTVAGLPLMEATGAKRKLLNWVEKVTYSSATKIYPNSKGLHDFIVAQKFTSSSKLQIIGSGSSNGIDTSFFSKENVSDEKKIKLKNELNIHAEDFVFIFVGRLVKDKGINELITAFTKMQIKNAKLLLVGQLEEDLDPLYPEVTKEIQQNNNIISAGFQQDVRSYFAISDALVFPSYREGFPNVVMQAGAMGLPSIVSNINGCNEIIVEGENGHIIPVKNVESLQIAMEIFIENKSYLSQLKSNARLMIENRYEQSVVWNALLQEYNSLLKHQF
ncbi:glycosyltransferase family 4 protein [Chryseobacterium wangxinyae]|uniref:glycosyltransferase family 4 protein n=1 Tax=Chryseobacterium sp. CY353 TaxID=2997334 RepID=UPI002271AFDE|nr:glycosyltransferase family 4 protein [Chryseobacterium sp. CY353]MCY0971140.1 glycosyltransferase family 4 protein [Chryseobacterium sp. CY353]